MSARGRGRLRAAPGLLAGLVATLLAGCARDPGAGLPEGTLLAGETAAIAPLLRGLEALPGSPAALAARRLEGRVAGCRRFLAHCPPGEACALASVVTCEPRGDLAAATDAVRGDAGWLFAHRAGDSRLTALGRVAPDGSLAVDATYAEGDPGDEGLAPWQALLPGGEAPAAPVLAGRGALLQLRLRSQHGADAFRGVAPAEAAQEHLGLAGDAFATLALEGTTELAIYEPRPGEAIPPLALALHTRLREAAVRGMEELLAGVRSRWPVSREPWTLGESSGACLSNLNVLPDLAPCYLSTSRALVLGWNRRSVELALAAPPAAAAAAAERSALAIDLERLAAADTVVRAAFDGERASPAPPYPWSRLEAAGRHGRDGYELSLRLLPLAGRDRG